MIPRHFQGDFEVKSILSFDFFHCVDICNDSTKPVVGEAVDISAKTKALVRKTFYSSSARAVGKQKQEISLKNGAAILLFYYISIHEYMSF